MKKIKMTMDYRAVNMPHKLANVLVTYISVANIQLQVLPHAVEGYQRIGDDRMSHVMSITLQ